MFDRLVSGWSLYGLEAARRRSLRTRLLKAIAAVLAVYLGIAGYLALTTEEEYMTSQFNNGVEDQQEAKAEAGNTPPIRVTLTPGRAAFSNLQEDGGTDGVPRPRNPPAEIQLKWINVLTLLGAYAGLYKLFAAFARGGIHGQVNFGVYKGSMPYELHSQSLKKKIFSHKRAKYSLPIVRKAEYYARIAPDFRSLFWERLLQGDPVQAQVVDILQPGRAAAKGARAA